MKTWTSPVPDGHPSTRPERRDIEAGSMTRALLALLLILGTLPLAAASRRRAAQPPPPVVAPAALVTAARQAAEASLAKGFPAVQIVVSKGDRVLYSEAFGVTDIESAAPATSRSVMQIGSVTKQFTAVAILRLAERGALSLDDRVEKFVPEFNPHGSTITLRQLLSHTSGLPRDWYKLTGHTLPPLFSPVTREEVITSLNSQSLLFKPGTGFSYSNAGFQLLGYVIESITGVPYAEFVHSELVLPLGLLDTGVCGTSNLPRPEGYGLYPEQPIVRMTAVNPAGLMSSGSLCSTAWDLTRWSHLLATGSVLSPSSYAVMTTRVGTLSTYALGVDVKNVLGHPAVSHDGAIDGFQSYLLYFPERDVAIAVMLNAYPAGFAFEAEIVVMAVAKAALDTL